MNRYPACKIRVIDLQKGSFVKGDNNTPNHVVLPNKQMLFRVHIIGTVLRLHQTGNSASIVIDDGSASILLRVFEEFPQIKNVTAGHTVSVIGKIRSYKEQVYIVPEIVKECDKAWIQAHKPIKIQHTETQQCVEKPKTNVQDLVDYITVHDTGSGITLSSLHETFGDIKDLIDNLLKHGVVYEHMPGKIKLL